MQELLDQLREKIESRNAIDFLADIVENFDGCFGAFLMAKQINRNECDCPDCRNDFAETIDDA